MTPHTRKQRMLNAYRGSYSDRPPVAPEFWSYWPAKLLGVDMIEFEREVPFHLALKQTFDAFDCEGWGIVAPNIPNPAVATESSDRRIDAESLECRTVFHTPHGTLTAATRYHVAEPGWSVEGLIKDPVRDLAAWECLAFDACEEELDGARLTQAWRECGTSYLAEALLAVPFFDTYASARDGGFEAALMDFFEPGLRPVFERLRERYIETTCRRVAALAAQTPLESYFIGCAWSCNSLLGPVLWREWDKPALRRIADEVHRHGKLLHLHFHGRSLETAADLAELGIDCVCPFERPPGGDVDGLEGLRRVRGLLGDRVTMNGNVHTVETLIRGTPDDVRREVREVLTAFAGTPRLIVGSGDQVGRETPEENLHAMIDEVKQFHY